MGLYYSMSVQTYQDGRPGCSVLTGGDTIGHALAAAFRDGTYYLGLGYKVVVEDFKPFCKHCHGAGNVRKGVRIVRYVKCPECRGKKFDDVCEPFELTVSESTEVRMRN